MEKVTYQGKTYRVFTLEAFGRTIKVICEPCSYRACLSLGRETEHPLAIRILEVNEGGFFEPWATLTVNLRDQFQSKKFAYVDTNNNSWAEEFIKNNGLGRHTDVHSLSGHCSYPLYEFYTNKFTI